jgi:dienelactone hydrolase
MYSAPLPAPGVLLLPECNGLRQAYDNLASMLNTAGYSVLTYEHRDSAVEVPAQRLNEQQQQQLRSDADAALQFLKSQPNVNPRALGMLAAGCAVNEALHASRSHPEVRALVLLSGSADEEAKTFIKGASKLALFGVASDEDEDAGAMKELIALSPSSDSEIQMLTEAGRSSAMFAKQPDLEPDIVVWFRRNLSVAGYGLPPAIK